MNIGMRHISLSTCGIVPKILELAQKKLQLTLSVSLHSPEDVSRSAIMPINRKWNLDALLGACRRYFAKTGRRISFEYTLIAGQNDSLPHAKLLCDRLEQAFAGGMPLHVNLIPLNPVAERDFTRSDRAAIERFVQALQKRRINATVRRRLGPDINASCGQLRHAAEKESTPS
jgi:23S rRNA (adenine2503-C2)-methyltransferase